MPLVIEDGTGADATANSYSLRAEIIAYAALRGVTLADDETTDTFAIKAMDYIEIQEYKGEPTYDEPPQPLSFPRSNIQVGAKWLANDEVPIGIKNAQCEASMLISQGVELLSNLTAGEQQIKRDKTAVLETEYFAPGAYSAQTPRLDALLKPYLVGMSALTAFRA
jgi:hypothetical protein